MHPPPPPLEDSPLTTLDGRIIPQTSSCSITKNIDDDITCCRRRREIVVDFVVFVVVA